MSAEPRSLNFPPLLSGEVVAGDPFDAALAAVAVDIEPGTIFYAEDGDVMRAALVLAPQAPLEDALPVTFAVALGLNDALGALAPPEVAVHLVWPDRIKVNGALCGRLRAAAPTRDPSSEPDWLIVGVEVPVLPTGDSDPGLTPDQTCLYEEGCGEVTVPDLIEAWARHSMNWLHIFLTEGFAPLHAEWRTKGDGFGEDVTYPETGHFVGLDERGGMIIKSGDSTRVLPLVQMLERP